MKGIFKKSLILLGLFLFGFSMAANAQAPNVPYAALKEEISSKHQLLSFTTRRISAKYPSEVVNKAGENFPGHRGPGQLVVYFSGFGETTGTNEYGTEAVIQDNVVVKLTGADSIIPKNGFVVSGHGSSKTWIKQNLKIGTKVLIDGNTIIAYITPDSFVYQAKSKIEEAEQFLSNAKKSDAKTSEDKKAAYYLKKAKSEYKKAERSRERLKKPYAESSIRFSNLAIKYALPYIESEFKGVWLRPTERNRYEIQRTLDKIQETGIKEVFLETYFHGYTIYPSKVMKKYGLTIQNPKFLMYDPLAVYVEEAHKRGLKIHCWFESFYIGNFNPSYDDKSILSKYPSWGNKNLANYDATGYVKHKAEHNGFFLDPANPEVTAFLVELLNEIPRLYNVDGINLDYTRYPTSQRSDVKNYQQSHWGYTDVARKEFMELYEVDPVEIEADGVLWKKWSEYRRDKIYNYVKQARETLLATTYGRKFLFSAVIFPDYNVCLETKQQDWAKWSRENLVDAMTPLILTSDNELFSKILKEVKTRASNKTQILTGLFVGFMDAEPEELLKQISVARGLKSEGIILFDWAHLPVKYQEALKYRVFLPKK